MVVGHILMVYTCSFLCTCYMDRTVHTPAFLQAGDYSRNVLYARHTSLSTNGGGTQQGMGMVMGHTNSVLVTIVTHPGTNQAHDCLTLVINREMLAPIYRGLVFKAVT